MICWYERVWGFSGYLSVLIWKPYELALQRTSFDFAVMSVESPHISEFMASETVCNTPCTTKVVISTTQNLTDLVSRPPQGRTRHRLENFFAWKSGSAYGLSHTLETSISSSVSSATKEEDTEGMAQHCNRGCSGANAWNLTKYTLVVFLGGHFLPSLIFKMLNLLPCNDLPQAISPLRKWIQL